MMAVPYGWQSDRAPQGDDGIEHRTDGVGQRRNCLHRRRIGEAAAPTDKLGAVRFAGNFALTLALDLHQVQQPRRFFLLGTGAARAKQGGRFLREFGLHEKIAERRMRRVRVLPGEHHFGVTRQFNLSRRRRAVGDRDASQLHVIFRRHADLGVDFNARLAMAKFRARLREDGFVAFRHFQGRLISGGPKFSGADVAQIDKHPPAVARGIFAPAR